MADLTRRMNEIIGTYKGNDVYLVSKSTYEELEHLDLEIIYAVYDKPANIIHLVHCNRIIGEMTRDGDVSDYRTPKIYKKAKPQKKEEKKIEEVSSSVGEIDIDAFIRDSLQIDLLAGWSQRLGIE